MSPVSNMSVSSSFLLLGLVLFVMFTLGRRRRTAGLVVVGLLGVVLCGAFLLTSMMRRVEVSSRHRAWPATAPAAPLGPLRPLGPHEDQAILVVDLDADELDDEDIEPAELAQLARQLCELERRDASRATLAQIERLLVRDADGDQLALRKIGHVSRQTSDAPETQDTLRIVRFRCPDEDDRLDELQAALHAGPGEPDAFLSTSFNRDEGTLDLVVESPTARRLALGHDAPGAPLADESLQDWEHVFGELHGPRIARAMRQEFESREQARGGHEGARAAVKDVIRESAQLADEAIRLPVDAVREATEDAVAEAHQVVASARAAAERAVDSSSEVIVVAPVAPSSKETPRPAWVDRPKEEKLESGYRRHVIGGPAGSVVECQRQLDAAISLAVASYVDSLLVPGAARQLDVSREYVESRILKEKWQETHDIEALDPKLVAAETEAGALLSLHALLEFDQEVENEVKSAWRDYQVRGRLWAAGIGSLGVLGVIGSLFGYLRFDTATKGYYSGRLKVATAAAILGVIAVVVGALALLLESGIGPR